jgi:prevent-host-death family protein
VGYDEVIVADTNANIWVSYHQSVMSKTIAVEEFRAHPIEVLERVAEDQEELIVLDNGKPLAKVVPMTQTHPPNRRPRTLEELRGSVKIFGDIVEPLDDEWEVMK